MNFIRRAVRNVRAVKAENHVKAKKAAKVEKLASTRKVTDVVEEDESFDSVCVHKVLIMFGVFKTMRYLGGSCPSPDAL